MNLLRSTIRRFDDWLSQREGVAPFTDDPRVIMRIQTGRAAHDINLPRQTIPAGAKILLLHTWNERMPLIPPQGPDLAYGLHLQRLIASSMNAVANHLAANPSMQDIQAVGGITAHITLKEADGGRAMLERLGFTVMPYRRSFGAFGEFWENFYTWWLMWTFNPASAQSRSLWRLQRTEFWMSRENFLARHGRTAESGLRPNPEAS